MMRFPVLNHGIRLVGDTVAPLVGAEHAGMIMHANMRVDGVGVVGVVSTVRTKDLLYRRAMCVNLRTTQCPN